MKRIAYFALTVATMAGAVAYMAHASGQSDGDSSPIYGVKIPKGYRDWKVIAVAQLLVPAKVDQLRAQFGNDMRSRLLRKAQSRFQTAPSLPQSIGLVSRRKTITKSWAVLFPALNLSFPGRQ